MNVSEIMTKAVITVSPEMDVRRFAELLVEKNISGVPVVDGDGKLLGVALEEGLIVQDKKVHVPTFFFFLSGFFTIGEAQFEDELQKLSATTVAGIMVKNIPVLSPQTPVTEAATMIVEKNLHFFPVVDKNKVVGVVTKKDIVRAIARGAH